MKHQLPALILLVPLFAAVTMPMLSLGRPRMVPSIDAGRRGHGERDRHPQSCARGARWRDTICVRGLGGSARNRVGSRRYGQRRDGRRLADRVGLPGIWQRGEAAGPARPRHPAQHPDPAPAVGIDGRGVRRGPVQRLRVPGGHHADDLRPHCYRRWKGAGVRVPVPHSGEHRRHVLPARGHLRVRRHRHAQHGRHGAAARAPGGIERGGDRRGVHVPRPCDQDGADAVSRVASRRVQRRPGCRRTAHLGTRDEGLSVGLDPHHVLGARRRSGIGARAMCCESAGCSAPSPPSGGRLWLSSSAT